MLQGDTKDIGIAVTSCLNESTRTTFIAAGCEIPKMTPLENMVRVDLTLKEAGNK